MLAVFIIVVGVLSRVFFHMPNFTPVMALALFSGVYLNKRFAILLPVVVMVLSDVFLGWHDTVLYTWGSMALIGVMGLWLKTHKNIFNIVMTSVAAAVLFFIMTNFGAWLSLYPRTWAGFVACYVAALPFFKSSLASTLAYSLVLFIGYEYAQAGLIKTRFARLVSTTSLF